MDTMILNLSLPLPGGGGDAGGLAPPVRRFCVNIKKDAQHILNEYAKRLAEKEGFELSRRVNDLPLFESGPFSQVFHCIDNHCPSNISCIEVFLLVFFPEISHDIVLHYEINSIHSFS